LVGLGDGEAGEAAEVAVGLRIEAERSGEGVDDLRARVDGVAVFEPRLPRHAHARELGDLFSAQAWRVAPTTDDVETDHLVLMNGTDTGRARRRR